MTAKGVLIYLFLHTALTDDGAYAIMLQAVGRRLQADDTY
jgi:hypothetical protein